MADPESIDCPTCGAPAGQRCLRLVQDPSTQAVRRRTEQDPPAKPGKRHAGHAHGERRLLAGAGITRKDGDA